MSYFFHFNLQCPITCSSFYNIYCCAVWILVSLTVNSTTRLRYLTALTSSTDTCIIYQSQISMICILLLWHVYIWSMSVCSLQVMGSWQLYQYLNNMFLNCKWWLVRWHMYSSRFAHKDRTESSVHSPVAELSASSPSVPGSLSPPGGSSAARPPGSGLVSVMLSSVSRSALCSDMAKC